MHDLATEVMYHGRVVWLLFGDFKRALPKCWRCGLLHLASNLANIRGGRFALLGSTMLSDTVVDTHSGLSAVHITESLPEGGRLGPTLYNAVPDSLIRHLLEHGCGFDVSVSCPHAWRDYRWEGNGAPGQNLVNTLVASMRRDLPLPTVGWL